MIKEKISIKSAFAVLSLVFVVVLASGCIGGGKPSTSVVENAAQLLLPKHDVGDKDIDGVPRYPDTTRVSYSFDECSESASYYLKGNKMDGAVEFYTSELENDGWNLESKSSSAGAGIVVPGVGTMHYVEGTSLTFSKGNNILYVDVGLVKIGDKEYTLINLDLSKPCGETGETSQGESTQEDYYESAADVTPPSGYAQQLDEDIRPVLISIFGGAKLADVGTVSTGTANYVVLSYAVPRAVSSEDIQELVNELSKEGYQASGVQVSGDEISGVVVKEGVTYGISSTIGSQVVEISYMAVVS